MHQKLTLLTRDELLKLIEKAGVKIPDPKDRKEITKEELLLLIDEADQKIIQSFLDKKE